MTIQDKIPDSPTTESIPRIEKSEKKSDITIPIQYIGGKLFVLSVNIFLQIRLYSL